MDKIKQYLRIEAARYGLRPRFVTEIDAIGTEDAKAAHTRLFGYATVGSGLDERRVRRVEMMIEAALFNPEGAPEALAYEAGQVASDAARAMGRDLYECQQRAREERKRVLSLLTEPQPATYSVTTPAGLFVPFAVMSHDGKAPRTRYR